MTLTLWGVRGSIPTPQAEKLGFGGNTACLEVRYDGHPALILDAGSGARRLGALLKKECAGEELEVSILFTHFHWDHIQGLPFFAPLYDRRTSLTFYSSCEPARLREIVEGQMTAPYFPVNMPAVQATCRYAKVEPEGMPWGDLHIRPFPLRHPDGATGYRIEGPSGSIVYASDHEHGDSRHDAILREHAAGADLLIYDAMYDAAEYAFRRGWGHSTWEEGVRAAIDAGVKRLVLFHHEPDHDDRMVKEMVDRASARFENTIGAKEGWSVTV
ncbi:MAG: MBL fold metallo-hydrolase [Bryobacteraceae bacterium]|nr:MBL fold metallo-hydrolase [Bryobacteraceae bacterium]